VLVRTRCHLLGPIPIMAANLIQRSFIKLAHQTMSMLLLHSVLWATPDHRQQGPASSDTVVKNVRTPVSVSEAELVPQVTIGTVDGPAEYAFTYLLSVAARKDGSVFVIDGSPFIGGTMPSVRQYDTRGQYVRTIGRTGSGPGEYRIAAGVALLPDDRLLVLDIGNRRVNVYSDAGTPVDSWNLSGVPGQIPIGDPQALIVGNNGVVYIKTVQVTSPQTAARPAERTTSYVRMLDRGVIVDRVVAPELPSVSLPNVTITRPTGQTATYQVPYSPRTVWKLSPLGYFVTARTDRYAVDLRVGGRAETVTRSAAGQATLREWQPGDTVVSIRRTVPVVPVSLQERRDRLNSLRARVPRGGRHSPIADIPATKPPIRWMEIGADGRIWVQRSTESERYEPDETEARGQVAWREREVWDVFDPSGSYRGAVDVPQGVQLIYRQSEYVWGFFTDESGVPFLRKYRIAW